MKKVLKKKKKITYVPYNIPGATPRSIKRATRKMEKTIKGPIGLNWGNWVI